MIVGMRKVLVYGVKEDVDRFFEVAQKAGVLEFIGSSHKKGLELPEEAKVFLAAIKIAKKHEVHVQEAPKIEELLIAKTLVELEEMHLRLVEEQRLLNGEKIRVAPFGDFSREDVRSIQEEGKRILQFFCMKSDLARKVVLPEEIIFIGTEFDLDYFVSINHERASYPKMVEIFIERPLGEVTQRLGEVREEIGKVEGEIRRFSHALPILQESLIDYLNDFHLRLAKHDASYPIKESIFAIEAWVPKTKINALYGLLSGLDVLFEEIAQEKEDRVPTCMENKGAGKIGEDLVHVYDAPAASDKDPSLWVLVFFSIFFAVIVSDAGYGLFYAALGLYLKWKFPKMAGLGRRFAKLAVILGVCSVAWGIATASFFGIEIGPNNPFRKVSLLHKMASIKAEYHLEQKDDVYELYLKEYPAIAEAKDGHDFLVLAKRMKEGKEQFKALETFYDNILMELSLLIGVIHLSVSLLRYVLRNWAGLGWVIFMVGGVLYFPKVLNATSLLQFTGIISKEQAYGCGLQLVYGGIGVAFVAAFLQKRWLAFQELTNVIQVFADVLSYIRLYALALAGAMVARTFNEMGMNAGLLGGSVIILLGHLNNIGLSAMGGAIHGLRLNFLEWYHYSFDGGGRLFNPLRLKGKTNK